MIALNSDQKQVAKEQKVRSGSERFTLKNCREHGFETISEIMGKYLTRRRGRHKKVSSSFTLY